MRSARLQAPAWPTENSVERRKFNERLADLINMAADADDARHLERSVTLSEQFLSTHFGHSTAHLNLSLALSQLGRFAEAQGPAHHAIYVDTSNWFCTETFCPAVIGSIVVYSDDSHLTDSFVRYRAPQMAQAIRVSLASNP